MQRFFVEPYQIEEEEHLQETLLERMVETETELADLQEQ